jgi:hypothetical protein
MPLWERSKTNSIRATSDLKQLRSQTNKVPSHIAMDKVAGLLIFGKGNLDCPSRMFPIFL